MSANYYSLLTFILFIFELCCIRSIFQINDYWLKNDKKKIICCPYTYNHLSLWRNHKRDGNPQKWKKTTPWKIDIMNKHSLLAGKTLGNKVMCVRGSFPNLVRSAIVSSGHSLVHLLYIFIIFTVQPCQTTPYTYN